MKKVILLINLINGFLCAANDRKERCGRMLARSFNIDGIPHVPTYLKEISQALAANEDDKALGFLKALKRDPESYSQFLDHVRVQDHQRILSFLTKNNISVDMASTEIEPLDL